MDAVHPSLLKRKIIHVDMDAFYAAVEMRDNPELHGKPVVIGGSPQSRAVVCTSNYEARKFGIRSAMSCAQAFRLCPQTVFLPPDFAKYTQVSSQIRAIFARYTAIIEPLSLDEAFLDVTANQQGLYASQIGKLIQSDVSRELSLTCSVGIGPNKLVAKIASDFRKPAGLTVVPPEKVASFMRELPVRKIFGVGPATEKRLNLAGIITCDDVLRFPFVQLEAQLGSFAHWIYMAAQGLDDRPVTVHRERRSMGREETFSQDLILIPRLLQELESLAELVGKDLQRKKLRGRTLTLKVKYHDFSQITRSRTLSRASDDSAEFLAAAKLLLLEKTEAGRKKIRLLGLSVSNLESKSGIEHQLVSEWSEDETLLTQL